MWQLLLVIPAVVPIQVSDLEPDEEIHFFESWGWHDGERDEWVLSIHAWVFELEADSWSRAVFLSALREAMDLEDDDPRGDTFSRRARYFLADNEERKAVAIRIGDQIYALGRTADAGQLQATVRVSAKSIESLIPADSPRDAWIEFRAVLPEGDDRVFRGSVQLLDETGISVVSDIDDTVKLTDVRSTEVMLAKTFLEDYQAADGMAELYTRWAGQGASIHFVSSSPCQLHPALVEFLKLAGFPQSTFSLKVVDLDPKDLYALMRDPTDGKSAAIERLIERFSHRRFVLVGDSGQQDPEIYGRLARKFPEQVSLVLIREVAPSPDQVDTDPGAAGRFDRAFRGVARAKWRVFKTTRELADISPLHAGATTRPTSGPAN